MNAQAITLIISKIASDLLTVALDVLDDDAIGTNAKVGKNTLRESALRGDLEARIDKTDDPVIHALFNNYVVFLEWTRPARYKKKPPISVLREWAERNNIPTDADTLWRISHAIWRDGHAGRPIFATMDERLDRLFDETWANELLEVITANLDNYFND